jgi:hypothetical protein
MIVGWALKTAIKPAFMMSAIRRFERIIRRKANTPYLVRSRAASDFGALASACVMHKRTSIFRGGDTCAKYRLCRSRWPKPRSSWKQFALNLAAARFRHMAGA